MAAGSQQPLTSGNVSAFDRSEIQSPVADIIGSFDSRAWSGQVRRRETNRARHFQSRPNQISFSNQSTFMPIPAFQTVMLPLLETLADGRVWTMREVTKQLAKRYDLTDQEIDEKIPSGQAPVFANRVAWAKTHMKVAGLIDNPNRGRVSISERGRAVLARKPAEINMKFLKQFDGYAEFTSNKKTTAAESTTPDDETVQAQSPLELLEESFSTLRAALKDELLTRLKTGSPAFFERAVLKLLTAMGYGITGDAQLTGQPGDGGIDGVIREDKLGLDIVCVQAKRYGEASVGRPTIQQFSGSMDGVKAKKGVILTTSSFSRDAIAFVDRIEGKRVVLIDGEQLAELMIRHNVGVATTETYELKALSGDFFDDDEG
jgi:restriction system protein